MRTTHGVAFRSFFVAQIRDSGFGYLCRSLSTTNSKNWRHKPFLVTEQKRAFCGQEFLGLWPFRTKTGHFVVRNFSGWNALWPGRFRDGPFCGQEPLQTRILRARFVEAPFTSGRNCSAPCDTTKLWPEFRFARPLALWELADFFFRADTWADTSCSTGCL